MKQMMLATAGFDCYGKTTLRAAFLAEMEHVMQWSAPCGLIEPVYPKPGNGRPPVGVERMLRIYFCNHGSTCRTRQWKRRFTIRGRCAVSSGSISAASRCPTRPRCAASAICAKRTSLVSSSSQRCGGILQPTGLAEQTIGRAL
jgi:hypothetical protein